MGNYIDLDFFQSYTRTTYDGSSTPTATEVGTYIDLSEQEINEMTGRTWGLGTYTSELYDKPNSDLLLNNYPVLTVSTIVDGDGVTLTEGIDEDYTIDGDFVDFINTPDRAYITYTAGYTPVRADAKMLTTLYTINKILQSGSSSTSNTTSISVGSISLTKNLGMNAVINIGSDTEKYEKRLRRLIR